MHTFTPEDVEPSRYMPVTTRVHFVVNLPDGRAGNVMAEALAGVTREDVAARLNNEFVDAVGYQRLVELLTGPNGLSMAQPAQ